MVCPACGSQNVSIQMVTESQLKTKHRGAVYWLCFGWLWTIIKWIVLFIPALIVKIFRPKRQKIVTKQHKMCVCQSCGHSWEI